eukprot:10943-Heterococcus_DN1.PRE.1
MALTAARARAVALVARPVVGRVAASQSRGLAGTFEDRERGEESVYFRRTVSLAYSFICTRLTVVHTSKHNAAYPTHTKDSNVPQTCSAGPWCCCTCECAYSSLRDAHEREQLEKLLAKMKNVEDSGKQQLLKILGPNKLPEDVIQKLLDWKQHF